MQCVSVDQFGAIVSAGQSDCQFVLLEAGEYLASASLDASAIAASFMWGFGTVITLWALSFAVKAALKAIKLV